MSPSLEYLLRLRLREATVRLANSDDGVAHIRVAVALQILKPLMWPSRNISIQHHLNIVSKQKRWGRKTKLHDWKEIISTQEEDTL